MSSEPLTRVAARARRVVNHRLSAAVVALLVCAYGTKHYFGVVDKVYVAKHWLFWDLATIWFWMAVLSIACLSAGHFVLERLKLDIPPLEATVQSMAVGVVMFVMFMYAGGALKLYGPVFAVVLPAAFIVTGARSLARLGRTLWAALREPAVSSPFVWLISALGACCIGLVYLGAMTPDALNYDSTWSHLVIAQDYARNGGIIKFWGNYNMGVPHLASLVHTWGYTVPGLHHPALRWMMALHNEFGLFCWTLVGVTAGVRHMLAEPSVRGAWAGFFLFPIIFVYDNNLGGAADHVAAFFVVPFYLAAAALWDRPNARFALLAGIAAAGGVLTKYQAVYVIVPVALLFAARFAVLAVRVRRGTLRPADPKVGYADLVVVPLVLVGTVALLVAPHFLKNVIFYNNPLYPFAQDVFTGSTPSSPNFGPLIRYHFTDDNWRPKGTTFEKLVHALKLFWSFSFSPHYSLTRNVPAFGSLFTLLLPTLLVLRNAARIRFAAAVASGSVLLWAYTYNIDRNLQIFLPLIVCVTVALIVRVWRLGWIARVGLVPLVLLQLVWGGDALFYSAAPRIESSMKLISSGYHGMAERRYDGYRSAFLAITRALPKDSRVLLHTSHVTLGIDREVVMDWNSFQGFISYEGISTPRELYDYLSKRNITHILFKPRSGGAPTKQEEVLFYALITEGTSATVGTYGGYRLLRFPSQAPSERSPYRVLSLGIPGYTDGLYPIKRLNAQEHLPAYVRSYAEPDERVPPAPESRANFISRVDAVILGASTRLDAAAETMLRERFSRVVSYPGYYSVWIVGKDRQTY